MGDEERSWLFDDEHPALAELDRDVAAHYLADENNAVRKLLARAALAPAQAERVRRGARDLVVAILTTGKPVISLHALRVVQLFSALHDTFPPVSRRRH